MVSVPRLSREAKLGLALALWNDGQAQLRVGHHIIDERDAAIRRAKSRLRRAADLAGVRVRFEESIDHDGVVPQTVVIAVATGTGDDDA